ncbi:YceI family protein [Crocinitomicaceae bacterium]|nr:YceI family protein [Crocinitomicaceae bacterium]
MKRIIAAALFMLPMLSMAQELSLDTEKATVSFNFVAEKVKGTVSGIDATLSLNLSDLGSSTIQGTADVSTLSTGTKMRDKHLKSDDFFHADQYPKMTFTSSSVEKKGEQYFAHGTLTIKGITKDVSFKMEMIDEVLIMTTMINAADYDVSPKKAEKSQVDVKVKVPFAK